MLLAVGQTVCKSFQCQGIANAQCPSPQSITRTSHRLMLSSCHTEMVLPLLLTLLNGQHASRQIHHRMQNAAFQWVGEGRLTLTDPSVSKYPDSSSLGQLVNHWNIHCRLGPRSTEYDQPHRAVGPRFCPSQSLPSSGTCHKHSMHRSLQLLTGAVGVMMAFDRFYWRNDGMRYVPPWKQAPVKQCVSLWHYAWEWMST